MLKNTLAVFLAVVVAMTVVITPLGAEHASARTVSDQDISNQELVARAASREAIEEYLRLLIYMVIMRMENQIESQN